MLKLSLDRDYKAAIYLRLSKEDGDFSFSGEKLESDSISNQRLLIMDYLKKHPEITVVKEYCDDGFTGANFERPDFNKMMDAVRAGEIDCIVVKDLSRFGREYIGSGEYIQKIFPRLGIRFIAINDHYDNAQPGAADNELVLPFKNLMNDSYCRDISIKVRSNLEAKRRSGQFVGTRVVFGYMRSPDNKNQLVIDPEAASVVQEIFKWKVEGLSPAQIADQLNTANVPSPIEYKKAKGSKQRTCFQTKQVALWSAVAIYRILKNEIYTGTLVQGKTTSPNHKVKKTVAKPSMREAIDEALSCSCNEAEFETALRQLGYRVYLGFNVKYATIRSLGSKRGTRLYRLGEEYDRPAIFKRLDENLQYDRLNTNRRYETRFYKFTYTWVDKHPPPPEYNLRKALYSFNVDRAALIEIYAVLFVLILDLTVQTIKSAVELLLPETQVPECVIAACMKPKSPEMRETVRFAERYTRQLMLLSQEKFGSVDEVRAYISDRELKIAEVQAYREHWKNKLKSAKTPEQAAEYTQKRNRCTEMLKNLRFQKQVAGTLVTDEPKIKRLLKSEQNIQRGNDPYEWANGYRMRDAKTDKTLSR